VPKADEDGDIRLLDAPTILVTREQIVCEPDRVRHAGRRCHVEHDAVLTLHR
jgi:hypothetical protein